MGRGCWGTATGRSGAAGSWRRGSGGAPGARLDARGLRFPALPAVQGRQSWAPRPLRRRSGCRPRPRSPSAATRRCFCFSLSLCPGAARPTSPREAEAAAAGTVPAAKARASTAQVGLAGARPCGPSLPPLPLPPPCRSPRPGWAGPGRGGPGSWAEGERGRGAGRKRAVRAWGPAWGRGVAVRESVCAGWLHTGGRECWEEVRPGRRRGGSGRGPRCDRGCTRGSACLCCEGSGEGGRPQAGIFCVYV